MCGRGQRLIFPPGKSRENTITFSYCGRGVDQIPANTKDGFPVEATQRVDYYEHVLRNEDELQRIRQYIIDDPMKWELDRENPAAREMETAQPWEV
jgi:hypothetical protein